MMCSKGFLHPPPSTPPTQSHQGLHVPDNKKKKRRFTTGSCPGAEKLGIPAATDVRRVAAAVAAASTRRGDRDRFAHAHITRKNIHTIHHMKHNV